MKPIKMRRGMKRGNPEFGVEIIYPGLTKGAGDSGIGAIGRIDRATVQPGHLIGMHPHRDDEILTYSRSGTTLHRDSVGNEENITASRLMMMNAGHAFQHEERMLGPEPTEALQIFLRPRVADLDPRVQFHEFGDIISRDAWRLLAAPEGAPLKVRAEAWVQDAHLSSGVDIDLPPLPAPGADRIIYVFKGEIRFGGVSLVEGEGVYLADNEDISIHAEAEADLVLFTTDPVAPVFKGGMFSGNILV